MTTLLRIDASGRKDGSTSRALANELVAKLAPEKLVHRDLADDAPAFVDQDWIGANFTDASERSAEQNAKLAASDALVEELQDADALLIATPIYNFGVPAALKAWIDQIVRAKLTFQYTENGPAGLLESKRAFLIITSGGTELGSDADFASGYLKFILGFVGITGVTVIDGGQQMVIGDEAMAKASAEIERLAA